ncbi:polysaccharide biosynthesis C-terminal domain-containing protein [Candidatus Caldatribacterium saccharofermentans]|uniref:polysaccharide biosynthesis C-terminal domain-containing protein n=1 Tax=Candidatus Caldatribacterium saccharofermentans TaxID=1454753 RepID=UPI003CFDAB0A
MPKLFYLTLQSTREGQAAHAHVHEILKGLRKRGWQTVLFEPRYPKNCSSPSLFKRFWEFIVVQVRLWRQVCCKDHPSIRKYEATVGKEEERRREFTPLVARTVLWVTALGALVLVLFSRWIVLLLYSEAFLPAVSALQALLVGIVALSAGRVLANDIAGRGFPGLNIYTGSVAVLTNVVLNLLWIPRYGIVGAAWASTASYTVSFLSALFFYCRLSGNRWTSVVLPQRGDWMIYLKTGKALFQWAWARVRVVL